MTPLAIRTAQIALVFATLVAFSQLFSAEEWPGGGFTAGVIASLGVTLQYVIFGVRRVSRYFHTATRRHLVHLGLLTGIGAGLLGVFFGDGFLGHVSADLHPGPLGPVHLSSALLFDVGIFLVVLGVSTTLVHELATGTPETGEEL